MKRRITISLQADFVDQAHYDNAMHLLNAYILDWAQARFAGGSVPVRVASYEGRWIGDFVVYGEGTTGVLGLFDTLTQATAEKELCRIKCSHVIDRTTGKTVHTF